jgi:hypothetical protein
MRVAGFPREQPLDVGAARAGIRDEHRRVVLLHESTGVALVPRVRQYDDKLAPLCARQDFIRRRDRVEQKQPLAVVNCIRRDDPGPDAVVPLRMRSLPVPQTRCHLLHEPDRIAQRAAPGQWTMNVTRRRPSAR